MSAIFFFRPRSIDQGSFFKWKNWFFCYCVLSFRHRERAWPSVAVTVLCWICYKKQLIISLIITGSNEDCNVVLCNTTLFQSVQFHGLLWCSEHRRRNCRWSTVWRFFCCFGKPVLAICLQCRLPALFQYKRPTLDGRLLVMRSRMIHLPMRCADWARQSLVDNTFTGGGGGGLFWTLPADSVVRNVADGLCLFSVQVPEPQDLVMISQCKCTAGDIARMEKIVEAKLGCLPQEEPVTSLTFLSLYHSLLEAALQQQLDLAILSCKLETVCCDAAHASVPSSRLALALLFVEVGRLPQHCAQRQVRRVLRVVGGHCALTAFFVFCSERWTCWWSCSSCCASTTSRCARR